jgi:hypothetical protein
MDINQVRTAIMLSEFSNEELNVLGDALKYARAQLGRQVKRALCVGASVEFTDNRIGHTYSGTVRKINIKYVHVETSRGTFRVPANMLTVI